MALAYPELVQPTIVRQTARRVLYCACTKSANPPFCDGSHAGTGILPRDIDLNAPATIAVCRCWKSADHPYCDGTHARLVLDTDAMK